eukprot:scaffold126264_cov40-Prasinocladus_malaysianus.AAC.2
MTNFAHYAWKQSSKIPLCLLCDQLTSQRMCRSQAAMLKLAAVLSCRQVTDFVELKSRKLAL